MEMIRLRYRAGKSVGKLYYNRKRYVFNKGNNFITEVPIKMFWDKDFFEPAPVSEAASLEEKVDTLPETTSTGDETVCEVCGFEAKNRSGLLAHKRIKHKGGM